MLPNVTVCCLLEIISVIVTPLQLKWIRRYGSRGIVLDDTFNCTPYDVRLATLLVLDNYGRGLPCGFVLSSQMRKEDLLPMFSYIRYVYHGFNFQ